MSRKVSKSRRNPEPKEQKSLRQRILENIEIVLDEIMEASVPLGKMVIVWIGDMKHEFTDPTMATIRVKVRNLLQAIIDESGSPAHIA